MDPMERELRREERRRHDREQLGERQPACILCNENRTECLERHHTAGEAYDPNETVILCRNCHAVQTDRQQHEGPPHAGDPTSDLAVSGNQLLGLSRVLEELARIIEAEGTELIFLSRVVGFVQS